MRYLIFRWPSNGREPYVLAEADCAAEDLSVSRDGTLVLPANVALESADLAPAVLAWRAGEDHRLAADRVFVEVDVRANEAEDRLFGDDA